MEIEIIKKIAKRSNIRILDEREKEEIIKNFIEVIGKYFSLEDREGIYDRHGPYKLMTLKLPFTILFSCFYEKYSWHPKTKEEMIYYLWTEVNQRIRYRIRMHGNKEAIEILIKIYGKRLGIQMLEKWARQNEVVASMLKRTIKNLKENENSL